MLAAPSRSSRPSTVSCATGGPGSARRRRTSRPSGLAQLVRERGGRGVVRRHGAQCRPQIDRQPVQAACRLVGASADSDRYKWIALSNATLAVLLATLDGSITIIAMPDIFRGIHLDPLVPANSFYLLWMILGYLVVTSVLIVSLGRLGDMVGRVRIYNLGFVIYTVASLLLAVDWLDRAAPARRT